MNSVVAALQQRSTSWSERLADYMELTRIRIALLIVITVLAAGLIGSWGQPHPAALLAAAMGTALISASASIGNQWLERERDGRMERTRQRPLPVGRIGSTEALALGTLSLAAGSAILFWGCGGVTVLLGLLTWLLYVLVYTPLKGLTVWNTWVGAVAGAMPIALGWLGCGGTADLRMTTLWMIVFFWQFPHFMAIAWIYRDDYARGGLRMMSVVDASGVATGVQAVAGALALLPIGFLCVMDLTGVMSRPAVLVCGQLVLGAAVMQAILAARFLFYRDQTTARHLLRASLVYLPLVLMTLALGPLF
jgi:protoheme IX farnesyltransferase